MIGLIILWFAVSFVGFGFLRGHFAHEFPAFNNNLIGYVAFVPPLCWAIALIFCAIHDDWHFRLSPTTRAERWVAHQRLWPSLSENLTIETFE